MFDSINKIHLYSSILVAVVLFLTLNFILGPTSVFGLEELIQNKTGYYFGVDTNTFDYLLIALIPVFGLILTQKKKKKKVSEMLKENLIILLSCVLTFSLALLILVTKIGSPGENPLIPQYLRLEPFKIYSTLFITFGIILPFIFSPKAIEQTETGIEEIGIKNE